MKTINKIFLSLAAILTVNLASAQVAQDTSMLVNGVCNMCKSTIEHASKMPGVRSAEWDVETKVLSISYNPEEVSLQQISDSINASGYDTEYNTASDEAYYSLHKCCYYRDPEVVKDHQK